MTSEQADARETAALAEIALGARDRTEFRLAALERLQRLIGCDSAVFTSLPGELLATLNKTAAMRDAYLRGRARYRPDVTRLMRAAAREGGVGADDELAPPRERERLRFYREIVQPQGITSVLLGVLAARRAWLGRVFLARHGRAAPRFRARDRVQLAGVLAVLSLGEGFDRHRRIIVPGRRAASSGDVDWVSLTPRELQLVDFVAQGWRNPEIALALGISRFTVRNQLVGVFRKVGASTRSELVRLAVEGGVIEGTGPVAPAPPADGRSRRRGSARG